MYLIHIHDSLHQGYPPQFTATHTNYTPELTPTLEPPQLCIERTQNSTQSRRLTQTFHISSQHSPAGGERISVEPNILVKLNSITEKQENIIQATKKKMLQLLNYETTHPESITRYHNRGMVLHIHSDY